MNVLSLFDGKSSGYTALELAGKPITHYYSSEVDRYAIQVSNAIHPNQTRLGDVTKWREWDIDWSIIDLVIAGSPCQGFSFAGKQLAFDDPRSKLFFVFVDILNHVKSMSSSVKFMLENVKMKKEHMAVIDKQLGVESIMINSALVSAQNRERNYWTNIPTEEPLDRGIVLDDIIDSECSDVNSDGWHEWWEGKKEFQIKKKYSAIVNDGSTDKAICMTARQYASWNGNFAIIQKGRGNNPGGYRAVDGKTPALTRCSWEDNNHLTDGVKYRKLTPRECFRLQTVPEHYIDKILNSGSIYSHSQNFYNSLIRLKLRGNKCKSVKSMTVSSQSQVEKLNCAISTTLDSLGMELQKQLGSLSIKVSHVQKAGASVTARLQKDSALSTIRHGSENTINQQENVRFVLKTSEVDGVECVLGTLNQSKNMETQIRLTLTPEENSSLMGIKASNISKTQTVDGLIELLRKRLLEENCEKVKRYITLMAINLITAKSIFLFANLEHNTYLCIDSLSQLQCNLLEVGIFTLKMENIKPTSNSALYKIAGNGWTDEVIAHIFGGL